MSNRATLPLEPVKPELDTGWDFDALAAPLPPPPRGLELGGSSPVERPSLTPIFGAPAMSRPPAGDESFALADLTSGPKEKPVPAGERQDQDEAQTTSRPWPNANEFHDVGTDEFTSIRLGDRDLLDVERRLDETTAARARPQATGSGEPSSEETGTGERTTLRLGDGIAEHRTWARGAGATPGQNPAARGEPSVAIDDDLLLGLGDGLPAADAAASDEDMPTLPGSADEALRTRILSLIHHAETAAEAGDLRVAVDTLEQVLASDPNSPVAQVTLHRHKDLILKIYETCLGEPTEVPVIAIPVSELGSQDLDHRAAFLLSRIDGSLTFEEILDIAGMPRLEAYRLLAGLVRRGILEFRQ